MAAGRLVPHQPPLRLIERLLEVSDSDGLLEAKVPAVGPFVEANGHLAEVAYVELMAQGYAALRGYKDLSAGGSTGSGFLVGVRKMRMLAGARCGDLLWIFIKTVATVDRFAVAEGRITNASSGSLLAEGSIKLWLSPGNEEKGFA